MHAKKMWPWGGTHIRGDGGLACAQETCNTDDMSFAELQKEAASLNSEERRKLAAFLTTLRLKETGEWEAVTAAAEKSRAGWVSLEEAKKRLFGKD